MQYICLQIGFDYNETCHNRDIVEEEVEKEVHYSNRGSALNSQRRRSPRAIKGILYKAVTARPPRAHFDIANATVIEQIESIRKMGRNSDHTEIVPRAITRI